MDPEYIVIMEKEGSHSEPINMNKMVILQTFLNYVFINNVLQLSKQQMVLKIFLMSFLCNFTFKKILKLPFCDKF